MREDIEVGKEISKLFFFYLWDSKAIFGYRKTNEAEQNEVEQNGTEWSKMEWKCHSIIWVFYDRLKQFYHSSSKNINKR